MRERYSAVRIAMLCVCLAACAAQTTDEEGVPSEPVAEIEDVPGTAAPAATPASAAIEPQATPTAVPADESPAASSDDALAAATPQARFFGVGTSCSPNPCRNGGTCVDQWLGYTCRCPAGFTGNQCQNRTASSRCGNGIIERSAGEDCEVGVAGWTDANCLLCLQTVYRPSAAASCLVVSDNILGPSDCPRAGTFTPTCLAVYGQGCYVACNNDSSCPIGFKCSLFAGTPYAVWNPQFAGYCR